MKKTALFLIIALASCVDGPETSTTEETILAPDAGADTSEGRKGGETVRCNTCD